MSTIAAYLDHIASQRMGLDANPEHSNRVAELLLDWKKRSSNNFCTAEVSLGTKTGPQRR
ncbi:hypothetical protein BZM26_37365 [Paraburkholderia strydomiana]|nr:hypothetical protein BZM26_37365 [Paraburkholderia strydomiana]